MIRDMLHAAKVNRSELLTFLKLRSNATRQVLLLLLHKMRFMYSYAISKKLTPSGDAIKSSLSLGLIQC